MSSLKVELAKSLFRNSADSPVQRPIVRCYLIAELGSTVGCVAIDFGTLSTLEIRRVLFGVWLLLVRVSRLGIVPTLRAMVVVVARATVH